MTDDREILKIVLKKAASQETAALFLGVERPTLGDWMRGKWSCNPEVLSFARSCIDGEDLNAKGYTRLIDVIAAQEEIRKIKEKFMFGLKNGRRNRGNM